MNYLVKHCRFFIIFFGCIGTGFADVVEAMVQKLEAAPAWSSMSDITIKEEGKKLEEVCKALAQLSPELIDSVIKKFLDKSPMTKLGLDPSSKIYVFNRFYFELPSPSAQNTVYNGGWFRKKSDPISNQWPWDYDDKGFLELKYVLSMYSGPEYKGYEEFRLFRKLFPKRIVR